MRKETDKEIRFVKKETDEERQRRKEGQNGNAEYRRYAVPTSRSAYRNGTRGWGVIVFIVKKKQGLIDHKSGNLV